jgi:sulfide:quinone oxidoreductase
MDAPGPRLIPLAPGLSVTGRLDRADIDALTRAGVRTIINNRPDGEDPGQLSAAEARQRAAAQGVAYHHIPITAASLTRADVDAFAAAVKSAPGPVVAHCRSGTRSSLLWALTRLEDGDDPAALIALAARQGIDIAALPAFAARLR